MMQFSVSPRMTFPKREKENGGGRAGRVTVPKMGTVRVRDSQVSQAIAVYDACGRNPSVCAETCCMYCEQQGYPLPTRA